MWAKNQEKVVFPIFLPHNVWDRPAKPLFPTFFSEKKRPFFSCPFFQKNAFFRSFLPHNVQGGAKISNKKVFRAASAVTGHRRFCLFLTGHFFHTLRPRSENTGLHFFWKKRKPKIGLFSKLFYTHYVQPNNHSNLDTNFLLNVANVALLLAKP